MKNKAFKKVLVAGRYRVVPEGKFTSQQTLLSKSDEGGSIQGEIMHDDKNKNKNKVGISKRLEKLLSNFGNQKQKERMSSSKSGRGINIL